MRCTVLLALLTALATAVGAEELPAPWLPLDPGPAHCTSDTQGAALGNAAVRFTVKIEQQHLLPAAFYNDITR